MNQFDDKKGSTETTQFFKIKMLSKKWYLGSLNCLKPLYLKSVYKTISINTPYKQLIIIKIVSDTVNLVTTLK